MAIEVRRYVDADAGALAELLNRNAYGPIEHGTAIDAERVRRMLAERGIVECVVGDDGEALRGCIALAVGSGRRAADAHERFAGLFVVDDRHRNSMLAGKLFREIFADRIRAGGVRTLRIEANPANARAFPLYLRVGFRARPGARPDEDGYVELVSHLPGLIDDLVLADGRADADDVAPKLNWRMMRAGRDLDPAEGVVERDGRLVIEYPIDTGDLELVAAVDYATGGLVEAVRTGGREIDLPAGGTAVEPPAPAALLRAPLADGHELVVADDGTVELVRGEGDGAVVLLRERWPVLLGADAPAVRRQGARRAATVEAAAEGAPHWRLRAEGDPIERELVVADDGRSFELVARPPADGVALAAPWMTMRIAEHAVRAEGGAWRGGPVLPGRWPADWGDFEAAREPLDADEAWWCDGATGMRLRWTGIARGDGRAAP
ncbi:MAG: GNAT family N-acetyltransferase, partial [Microbacteriaceae bacterium]|nr:GNAT family N-acetyltransferase [Microbacteriaceae bacterium]